MSTLPSELHHIADRVSRISRDRNYWLKIADERKEEIAELKERMGSRDREAVALRGEIAKLKDQIDGWIAWEGGECPVPNDALVIVKFRIGVAQRTTHASFWNWHHDGESHDIVAYRVMDDKDEQIAKLKAELADAKRGIETYAQDLNDSNKSRLELDRLVKEERSKCRRLTQAADMMAEELESVAEQLYRKSAAVGRMGRRIRRLEAERSKGQAANATPSHLRDAAKREAEEKERKERVMAELRSSILREVEGRPGITREHLIEGVRICAAACGTLPPTVSRVISLIDELVNVGKLRTGKGHHSSVTRYYPTAKLAPGYISFFFS